MSKNTKRIVMFLAVTFGLMYLSHGLIALLLETTAMELEDFPLNILGIIGGGSPAFAALFMVYKMYSEEERKNYWNRAYLYKVHWFWWMVALLSPLVIGLGANLIYHGGWWNPDIQWSHIAAFPLTFGAMIFAGGAEELGWRGILQNSISKKVHPVVTGILIGIIWAIWHGPLFLIDVFAHYNYAFSTYFLFAIVYSLLLTLLVYKTRSILLAVLMHAGINAFGNLGFGIPMEVHEGVLVFLALLFIGFASALHFAEKSNIPVNCRPGDRGRSAIKVNMHSPKE